MGVHRREAERDFEDPLHRIVRNLWARRDMRSPEGLVQANRVALFLRHCHRRCRRMDIQGKLFVSFHNSRVFRSSKSHFLRSLCLLVIVQRQSQNYVLAIGFDGRKVLNACSTHQTDTNCDDVAPSPPRMCGVQWCHEPHKAYAKHLPRFLESVKQHHKDRAQIWLRSTPPFPTHSISCLHHHAGHRRNLDLKLANDWMK